LDSLNIKATFFLIGEFLRLYPDVVRNAIQRGHQIAHHGYLHQLMDSFTEEQVVQEVYRWEQIYLNLNITTGRIPTFYRIRSGAQTPITQRVLESFGYTTVHWAILNSDSNGLNGDQIFEKMTQHFGDGSSVQSERMVSIIQMHDREPATVESFPRVAEYLRRVLPNAQFVTMEQCLGLPAYRDYLPRNVSTDPSCSRGKLSRDSLSCCPLECNRCGGNLYLGRSRMFSTKYSIFVRKLLYQ
jgi:peptidoglycan/xylan/chitin deacetylase (PgdA/CDA1 family)